jgi:4a-hydroxytetrahydrobiopterin dehydratase
MNGSVTVEKNLGFKKCSPLKKGERPSGIAVIKEYLTQLSGWKLSGKEIVRVFKFKNFYETIGFVNALAYIANREDHHPDLEVGYKTCKVRYSSHEVGGLSENDFICATKIDELLNGIS